MCSLKRHHFPLMWLQSWSSYWPSWLHCSCQVQQYSVRDVMLHSVQMSPSITEEKNKWSHYLVRLYYRQLRCYRFMQWGSILLYVECIFIFLLYHNIQQICKSVFQPRCIKRRNGIAFSLYLVHHVELPCFYSSAEWLLFHFSWPP